MERRLIGCFGLILAALMLLAGIQSASVEVSVLFTSLACLSASATIAAWWGVVTEISGNHLGTLFGLLNSLGVPGAVASQLFIGSFAERMGRQGYTGRDQWDPGFYVYVGVLLVGAVGWLFIDAKKSVVEPSSPPA